MKSSRARLRIVHAIDSMAAFGGTELNAVRTLEHLAGNHTCEVFTLNSRGSMLERYQRSKIPVSVFPVSSLVGAGAVVQVRRMARRLHEDHVDVVHAHDVYTNLLVVLAARMARVRVVIASKRWTRTLQRRHSYTSLVSYAMAHRILVNSSEVGRSATVQDHVSPRKIAVIPNFVDDTLLKA